MKVSVELERQVPLSPRRTWAALLDPRTDFFGKHVGVQHEGLTADNMVRLGSRVVVRPAKEVLRHVPLPFRGLIRPIGLEVAELDDERLLRQDAIQPNRLVSGSLTRHIERDRGSSLVVVEADLAISSILDILTSKLPGGATAEDILTRELRGNLDSLEALASEMATANHHD